MIPLEVVTDPAWSDGLLFIGAIPVVMIVVAGLQELGLRLARRAERSGDRR